jgi:signal transduction histidine kinase
MTDQTPRVLVVDDDAAKRYVIARALRRAGFDVAEGATGADALGLAPGAELVVLDVRLPDGSGFDVCRRLKADPATVHTPVLLLSGTFVDPDSQVRGLDSGADAYLTDATEPPVLVATVRALLRMRRAECRARDELERLVAERTAELSAALAALEVQAGKRRELARRLVTAAEDQRRRIARELHDEMGQFLTALILGLKALDGAAPAEPLARLYALADRIAREMHRVAMELRPTALDDLGLFAVLRHYAAEWSGRAGVPVELSLPDPGSPRLPAEVETTAYRVVQEALTNVLRHAAAAQVGVAVRRRDGEVVVIVEDDGRGFDPARADPTRLGLAGMRERAALLGGVVEIESAPGKGTVLYARIPLPAGA